MKLKHLLVAALMLVAGTAMAQMPQMPPIPVDPEVRMGKLANGLTYYVRHNEYPEHRVNFYIAQRVGSIQEEESQRGLAHFLEHMAFNGTVNYPGNGVIDYTRTLGVEFGRDLNAYTSVDQTVYNINDVPSTRQSALDSCLLILKDWSNGLLLEDEEIDKERGVIHEEWRLRSSASQRILERNLETLYPGSKYGKRMPIGLMSVIDNFKYNEIRDYYHKWYRPDNQAIIVVGDIDVDATEAKIKEMFGSIPAAAADAAQVVDEVVPDNEKAIIVVDKDKEQQYSIVEVMFKHEATTREEKASMAYMIEDYVLDLVGDMLNKRFAEKTLEADCPFLQASCGDGNYLFSKTKGAFTVYFLPKEGKYNEAMKAVMTEINRAVQHGFTGSEFVRAREEYMSRLEKTYNERTKISNERYGRSFAANYLEGEPIPSIEQEYQIMQQITPMIPVEALNQLLPQLVSKDEKNLVVLNLNQEKDGAVYPEATALHTAITDAFNAPVEAYVDNVKDEPLIANLPKPGKIVKEKAGDKFGYTELTLSNGAKVVLKKTDFKENEIMMQAESKGGKSLYDKKDWANLEMFDYAMMVSGLGEFDATELEKALAGKQANASLSLSTSYESVSGKSTVKDLETMFQLAYLRFTDIRKDEKSYGNLMSQLETVLKNKDLQPEAVFGDSVNNTIENHSWRELPFNAENLKDVNYDRIMQIAKERTANAADFTFYFVGNFDEKLIREYICQYIASLPGNPKKLENYKNVIERPAKDVVNQFTRKMETPKANARFYWYTYDKTPFNLENSIKAKMAAQVLDKIYLKKIREDAGAAYSAGARGGASTFGDMNYTYILGSCPFKPDMKDLALDIMRQEINTVASTVDEATLKDIKEVMIKDFDTNVKENGYWLQVLNFYVSKGTDINSTYKALVEAQTPASISAFVKNVLLAKGTHVEVIMLPEE
ncbi:M16 family metallopeptidase [Sodaliphilus sp.]|uniref:M16 family metallopeptidase n=1 Tax=Sodaliphilus sp. TaxID=2815818 RepID=UPI00388FADEB